jgi:carbon monoxide dehydrogenase subunit G
VDLTHRFTVPASVEETWAAFNDIESVASCFPGATVSSVEGEEFKGSCKVKLGPIALVYSGAGRFVERDETGHRFVVDAKGKDKRGNGTAGATVTATLSPAASGATEVEVNTDLAITGKPAQFGRGVIQDVSDKLLQQFVDCLESKVGAADVEAAPDVDAAATVTAGRHAAETTGGLRKAPASTYAGASAGGAPGGEATGTGPGRRPGSEDALDLGATMLPVLLRAYWKPLAAGVVALVLLRRLRRRR